MRIFTRYILREVVGYAFLGGLLFTFILFMRYLLPLMELVVRGAASPLDIVKVIGFLLPSFFTLTIPMSVLIGILLGLSRLSSDSEITAMRASGLGVVDFIRIVGLFAGLAWCTCLANTLYIAPHAATALLEYQEQISSGGAAAIQVQPRVFYEDFKNYVLYVQDTSAGPNGASVWHNVFLADLTQPATPHIITSQEAVASAGGPQSLRLQLFNGARHDIDPKDSNQYDIASFNSTEIPVQTGQQEDSHISRRDTPMQAMPFGALWAAAHTGTAAERQPYRIQLQSRFAFPAACLVLMLVGVPLGDVYKRQFLNAVTHELKTPIASMRLYLDTLERRNVDEAQRAKFYGIMRSDTDRLLQTVERVLKAGELGQKSREELKQRIELHPLVAECVKTVCERNHLHGDAIELADIPGGVRLAVFGIAEDIRTAVLNLLENAVKYSPDSVDVSCRIGIENYTWVTLSITDAGIGISSYELKRIFKRFYRAKSTDLVKIKGTGLGLFLVSTIARQNGGSVRAYSDGLGKGSTMVLKLPLAITHSQIEEGIA